MNRKLVFNYAVELRIKASSFLLSFGVVLVFSLFFFYMISKKYLAFSTPESFSAFAYMLEGNETNWVPSPLISCLSAQGDIFYR